MVVEDQEDQVVVEDQEVQATLGQMKEAEHPLLSAIQEVDLVQMVLVEAVVIKEQMGNKEKMELFFILCRISDFFLDTIYKSKKLRSSYLLTGSLSLKNQCRFQ